MVSGHLPATLALYVRHTPHAQRAFLSPAAGASGVGKAIKAFGCILAVVADVLGANGRLEALQAETATGLYHFPRL